ncbi:hypothetical protein J6590_080595 [Homalodisca vitripennis]|nr:hypothetical protein J6590_080595 [Homalodisca vitripennis]
MALTSSLSPVKRISSAKNHTVADIAAIYISDLTLHNISQRRPINNKQLDLVLKKILWTHRVTDIRFSQEKTNFRIASRNVTLVRFIADTGGKGRGQCVHPGVSERD